MPKKEQYVFVDARVKINLISTIKQIAKKEFEERRACQRSEIEQYVKTICELQRSVKVLKSQVDRLESQLTIK